MSDWHRETSFLLDYPSKSKRPAISVIGAFNGTIAGLLIDQHPEADHHLFEPQDWACKQLGEQFGDLSNVHIHQFGLGDRDGTFQMGLYRTYCCSFMRGPVPLKDGTWYNGELREFGRCMKELGIEGIYYASMNIEAYEYVLLPYMAEMGWLKRCEAIGISWHNDNTPGYAIDGPYTYMGQKVHRYWEVQDMLSVNHKKVVEADNWQSWVLKTKRRAL